MYRAGLIPGSADGRASDQRRAIMSFFSVLEQEIDSMGAAAQGYTRRIACIYQVAANPR
jgi:hypothetical protein